MYAYGVGGLTLASTTALTGLWPAGDFSSADLHMSLSIENAELPQPDSVLFRWPGRYGLTLGTSNSDWLMTWARGAGFLISKDGRDIRVCCDLGTPDDESVHVLVRRVLPRIALKFGTAAIHAGALGKHGNALLIMGGSGAGKSTLSAALGHHYGWDLLSDDISILRKDDRTTLSSAATGVCLWADSRDALALPRERCHPLPAYGSKVWFDLQQSPPRPRQPLRALISLARADAGGELRLDPIDPVEALIVATRQLIQFNPAEGRSGAMAELVDRLRDSIDGIPAYTLSYPADYDALPRVSTLLEELVS